MRREARGDTFDVIDVLHTRVTLRHWTSEAYDHQVEARFAALDVIAALRALTRPLDDTERECLRLADAAGV